MKLQKFLKKYIINNIGYKVLAIALSFLLWLVILNITDPENTRTIYNVPVRIENEQAVLDGTHVYTIASGDTTNIIVTGKRSILNTLSQNDFIVSADFQELSITNAVPIKVQMTGDKQRYASQITYSTRDTSMVINLEDMASRQLQVELEYKGDLPSGVVIDEANISPKKVNLSAPQSIVDSADKVVVTADSIYINSDTQMTLEPVIRNYDGGIIKQEGDVSLDVNEISVEFKVSYKKDVPIVVNVSGRPGEGIKFRGLELSQDLITVKGPAEAVNALNRVVIPNSVIRLQGATEDYDVSIDVTPYLPENVAVFGESPVITVTVKMETSEEEKESTTPAASVIPMEVSDEDET